MHKIVENIITSDDVEYLKNVFNRHDHIIGRGMDKVLLPLQEKHFADFVKDLIERRLGITSAYEIVGDNFYKHGHSYFPHCDAVEEKAWLNIVLPIARFVPRNNQKFIVFDQIWTGKNITWLGNFNFDGDFYSNKKTNIRPCDGEFFSHGTNQSLPDDIWQYLDQTYFAQDYFYSMSGTAYSWEPGHVIVFDSRHIHATGRMESNSKLGVSIRIAHQ